MSTLNLLRKIEFSDIRRIKWNKNSDFFVCDCSDKNIYIFNPKDLSFIALKGHENEINGLDIHPNSEILVSSSYGQIMKLWNVSTGMEIASKNVEGKKVSSVKFSATGKYIFTSGFDDEPTIKIYESSNLNLIKSITAHNDNIISIAAHPIHENSFITGSFDGEIKIWFDFNREHLSLSTKQSFPIMDIKFSSDGNYFAFCGHGQIITVYNFPKCEIVNTIYPKNKLIYNIDFLNDSNCLISSSSLHYNIEIFDLNNSNSIFDFDEKVYSDDGNSSLVLSTIGVSENNLLAWYCKNKGLFLYKVNLSKYQLIFGESKPVPVNINYFPNFTSLDVSNANKLNRVKLNFENGELEEALNSLNLIDKSGECHYYWVIKGKIYRALNDFSNSLLSFKKSFEYDDDPETYLYVGEIYSVNKDYQKAIYCFSEAIDVYNGLPNEIKIPIGDNIFLAQCYYNLAINKYNLKSENGFLEAIKDGNQSLLMDKMYFKPYYIISVSYFQLYLLWIDHGIEKDNSQLLSEAYYYLNHGIQFGDKNCIIIGKKIQVFGIEKSIFN